MQAQNKIQKIVIIGGGIAGWMSAALLNKILNRNAAAPNIEITLIEDIANQSVGTGIATLPMLGSFFDTLGINEANWMEACNATYKLAIKFIGWKNNQSNDQYWHTLGYVNPNQGFNPSPIQQWVMAHKQGYKIDFASAIHETVKVCDEGKSPKGAFKAVNGQQRLNYGYHLDINLLVSYLKEICLNTGIRYLNSEVEKVSLDQKGWINSVITKNRQQNKGDMFIDCSGSKSILLKKAMDTPWVSYQDSLFIDSVMSVSTPYPDVANNNSLIEPYTTAKAQQFGWTWKTPLRNNVENGYVYSSKFTNQQQIEAEFAAHLDCNKLPGNIQFTKLKVGKFKHSWVKNCVSIGLAGGFIEPLESTGLALIQLGIQNLIKFFPDKSFDELLIEKYNEELANHYENIRDFIILHYCLTKRVDTSFWRAVKFDTKLPDSLAHKLEQWRQIWPSDFESLGTVFDYYNYASVLAGMGVYPDKYLPNLDLIIEREPQELFNKIQNQGEYLSQSLPTQRAYFRDLKKIANFQLDESW